MIGALYHNVMIPLRNGQLESLVNIVASLCSLGIRLLTCDRWYQTGLWLNALNLDHQAQIIFHLILGFLLSY